MLTATLKQAREKLRLAVSWGAPFANRKYFSLLRYMCLCKYSDLKPEPARRPGAVVLELKTYGLWDLLRTV